VTELTPMAYAQAHCDAELDAWINAASGSESSLPRAFDACRCMLHSGLWPNASCSGKLTRELMENTIKQGIGGVTGCYRESLEFHPELAGDMEVRFVISPDGSVPWAGIRPGPMGVEPLAGCVEDVFHELYFSEPMRNGFVFVGYPFRLSHKDAQ